MVDEPPSRNLPPANQKVAGFAAYRPRQSKKSRASGSAGASSSATAKPPINEVRPRPKPNGIGGSVKKKLTLHDPDDQHPSSVSDSQKVKKRKLDEMEIIDLECDEDSIKVLNSEELRDTGKDNKASTLVRAALAKAIEGEKKRLRLETSLRQQITSLESKLQQEKRDHDDSKRHIRDLERGLLAAASSMELTNTLIQTTSAQLIETHDIGPEKE